jgi:phosphohistidine phosphatase
MDLVLWRHAQAKDAPVGGDDLSRPLTGRGKKQAARIGGWLDRQLPKDTIILCSPARRCEQTAMALGRKFQLTPQLAPGAGPQQILNVAQWPGGDQTVLIVGHEPTLGDTAASLLQLEREACQVRKGAVWWLRAREESSDPPALIVAVQSPDSL